MSHFHFSLIYLSVGVAGIGTKKINETRITGQCSQLETTARQAPQLKCVQSTWGSC